MKLLHFTRVGSLDVAYDGNKRFVIERIGCSFRASVFLRTSRSGRPQVCSTFELRSEAIHWLSKFYEGNGRP